MWTDAQLRKYAETAVSKLMTKDLPEHCTCVYAPESEVEQMRHEAYRVLKKLAKRTPESRILALPVRESGNKQGYCIVGEPDALQELRALLQRAGKA